MAANEDELGGLHTKVAQVLTKALEGQTIPAELDEEGNEINPAVTLPPSAALITASIQFLKNNNITCTPAKDNALGELEEAMKLRAQKRAAAKVSAADLENARKDAGFLSGLPN